MSENGRMLPGQLALWQVGNVVYVRSSLGLVASAARPVGTVAGGQSCRPLGPVTGQPEVYHIGQGLHLVDLSCLGGSVTGCSLLFC
jgi:hypothetical protein